MYTLLTLCYTKDRDRQKDRKRPNENLYFLKFCFYHVTLHHLSPGICQIYMENNTFLHNFGWFSIKISFH